MPNPPLTTAAGNEKGAGRLNLPPSQSDFDKIPLPRFTTRAKGVFLRAHGMNMKTKAPWHPIYWGKGGASRFDPEDGPGTLYLGTSLAGVLGERFNDKWGAVGSGERILTVKQAAEVWITRVWIPEIIVFDGRGLNPSKIGTSALLFTGAYYESRKWALRLASHPAKIGGIMYPSPQASG